MYTTYINTLKVWKLRIRGLYNAFRSVLIFFPNFVFLGSRNSSAKSYEEGTLKWKSHETTKANTIQARRKLRNRWPCQKFRDSVDDIEVETAAVAEALLASVDCSVNSISLPPTTLRAIEWQISHVLDKFVEWLIITFQGKRKDKSPQIQLLYKHENEFDTQQIDINLSNT